METNNGDLPADIITQILLKLPVKSIIRFKSVANTWNKLFQNPSFVFHHHSNSRKKKRFLVHYCYYDRDTRNICNDIRLSVDEALVSYHDLSQQPHSPFSALNDFHAFRYDYRVDHGLFCLLDDVKSRIALWNPATREYRILPQCNRNLPSKLKIFSHNFGFGLDPLSNDYKVICKRGYQDLNKGMSRPRHHAAVYNMSTDSWRVLKEEDVHFFQHLAILNNSDTCVNGTYYWLANEPTLYEGYNDYYVLAFCFSTEAFQLIKSPIPPICGSGVLLAIHDRICIWESSDEVWMLNDESHWTKFLKIEPIQNMFGYGFWKKGKVLGNFQAQLFLYDIESEEIKELGIEIEGQGSIEVCPYEETLVSLRRRE
ncbi:hypothetical protein PTKIN_Ptkin16aG0094500 [Pterospermum kingtungense]